jgi:hypothetical protein
MDNFLYNKKNFIFHFDWSQAVFLAASYETSHQSKFATEAIAR